MKTVSVIIPFYSRVDWLCEAIESVLAQTYPIHEIILVNDGSREDLTEFLSKYGDKIIYIVQENSGPAAARNNAINHATGDYIAFEDADDIWLPNKLEMQVAFMEQLNAMWSHTGFYYWWPETKQRKIVNTSRDYGDIYLQRHVSTQIATPSVMIDRKLFQMNNFGFPTDVRNGEDDRLYLDIAEKYKIALIETPLLLVRMRGNNSQSHAIERFHLRRNNYRRWMSEGKKLPWQIHFIYKIYGCYAGLFKLDSNAFSEFIAKCFWTLPYVFERLYIRYLFKHVEKDESYILRSYDTDSKL